MAFIGPPIILASNAGTGTGTAMQWPGGNGTFTLEGTTPGASLQMQTPNGTWLAVSAATTLAAAGVASFALPPCQIRVNVTAGSAVYAYAMIVPTAIVTGN